MKLSELTILTCVFVKRKHEDRSVCSGTFTKLFHINKIAFLELTKSQIHKAVDIINSLTVIY